MKKKFTVTKSGKWVTGICYGKQHILHLTMGTLLNEQYAEWIVAVLNGKRAEPPYDESGRIVWNSYNDDRLTNL